MITPRRLVSAFTLLLVACVSAPPRLPLEPAGPSPADYAAGDLLLLELPQYQSVRGAAASEPRGSGRWQLRAVANALHTDYYRRREGSLYRMRDRLAPQDREPHLCIALSGGGMRSLAFTAGVLHALQQRGRYAKTDVISGVSGGGYTAYWLAAAVARGATEPEILADAGSDALTYLMEHAGELLLPSARVAAINQALVIRWIVISGVPNIWNTPGDTAGSLTVKDEGWNSGYATRLDRLLAGSSGFAFTPERRPRLSSRQLQDIVAAGRIPVPVWLTAARPGYLEKCVPVDPANEILERSRRLTDSAFELSPFISGSEEHGFLAQMIVGPRMATAASSAAMIIPFDEQCPLLGLLNASLEVEGYPAPQKSSVDQPFDLIDGGTADNLAVFPLVRRLCTDITVIDAEFDPYLVFEGYGYLKQKLAGLDISLSVPALESIAARNRAAPSPDHANLPCNRGVCLIRPRPECVRRETSSGCIAGDQLPSAIFEGQIGPIPMATRKMGDSSAVADSTEVADSTGAGWVYEERTLRVHYVKLSLDGEHLDQYPATVRERYRQQAARRLNPTPDCVTTRDNDACGFPHEPTADLDYRGGQFEAYWDLGRCIIERQWTIESTLPAAGRCTDSPWPPIKR